MENVPYAITELGDAGAVRDFAYEGKKGGFIGITEDEVKAAVKSALERRSYEVIVQWGQKSGPDVEAKLGGARIVMEVKGEGRYRQMLGNYFLQGLAQIILRMDDVATEYALALPAHASHAELVLKVPRRVREALRLDFYFVRPMGTAYELGVFRWMKS